MSRRLRTFNQGDTHHLFSICHGRRNLLQGEKGREYFVEAVRRCREKYDFDLIAAAVAANQIHLVIRTDAGTPTISRIMQYIKSRIAERYNRDMGRTGPFWNSRFRSAVIDEKEDLFEHMSRTFRERNALRKKSSGRPVEPVIPG